jgi:hypothetical protein
MRMSHITGIMIPLKTDSDVLQEIGRTLLSAERGANPRLATLIKILRALDRLDAVDAFLPDPGLSPMALLKLKGKQRRRATRSSHA